MDGNKDDAEKCIELATRYIQEGNREKAEKLLLKSERLYPTVRAKDLLNRLRLKPEDENLRKKSFSAPKKGEPAFRVTENKENIEANKDHLDAVKRIKKCKDYYEMLGVTKEATDSEIKKAYKKLALQLHPDKNKSPGAVEAFKALGNAASILMDPEKRKQYDLYGTNEDRVNSNGRGEQTFHYSRGFEADVTAEELFNMFFGGGFPANSNVHVRRNRMYRTENINTHHREPQNSGSLLQLVPILLLIGLSMMSSIFVSDPIYSMNQSTKFPIQRKTFNLKIPYYVKENFANEQHGSLRRLELGVEEEYVNNLRHACYKERSYRDSLMYKARTFNDRDLMMKAQQLNMPSCDTLNHLHQGAQ